MTFSCHIKYLVKMDASVESLEVRVHEGFDFTVAGVDPPCLPVIQ